MAAPLLFGVLGNLIGMTGTYTVGIVGAAGYTGLELIRLLEGHPSFTVSVVTGRSDVGHPLGELYASVRGGQPLLLRSTDEALDALAACSVVFCAMPHGESYGFVEKFERISSTVPLIDLSSDFRLKDPSQYGVWYGRETPASAAFLAQWVYGQPELFREEIRGSRRVANPGCFASALLLAAAPLARCGILGDTVMAHGVSGTSGAGKSPSARLHFSHLDEDFSTYRVAGHQHVAEVEQALARFTSSTVRVALTTSLVPMTRGIQIVLTYAMPDGVTEKQVKEAFLDQYANEPFVVVLDAPPHTKAVRGSNMTHLFASVDQRTQSVTIISVIDNLVKGAAGTAIQNANLVCGLDETLGLPRIGMYP